MNDGIRNLARIRLLAALIATPIAIPSCLPEDEPPEPAVKAFADPTLPEASFSMRVSCDYDTTPRGRRVGLGDPDVIAEVCNDPDLNMDRVGNTSQTPLGDPASPMPRNGVYAAGICPGSFVPELLGNPAFEQLLSQIPDLNAGRYTKGGGNRTAEITGLCLEIASPTTGKKATVQVLDALMPDQKCTSDRGRTHMDLHACTIKSLGLDSMAPDDGEYLHEGATWRPVECPYAASDARIVLKTDPSKAYGFMPLYTRLPVTKASVAGVDAQPELQPGGLFQFTSGGLEPGRSYDIALTLADDSTLNTTVDVPATLPRAARNGRPGSQCEEQTECRYGQGNHSSNDVYSPECVLAMPNEGAGGGRGESAAGGGRGESAAGGARSKSDCDDKPDGWWCLESIGSAWMAYCKDKQIAGGCACAACTTSGGGVAAACSAAPPPAACPS